MSAKEPLEIPYYLSHLPCQAKARTSFLSVETKVSLERGTDMYFSKIERGPSAIGQHPLDRLTVRRSS
jgi:hypothetical protein